MPIRTRRAADPKKRSRREAAAKHYHSDPYRYNRMRYLRGIKKGTVKKMTPYSLKKYGLTPEEFNDIRKCNGMDPVPPPDSYEVCPAGSASPASPPPAPPLTPDPEHAEHAEHSLREHSQREHSSADAGEPAAASEARPRLKLSDIVRKIHALKGRPMLNSRGGPMKNRKLTETTLQQYASGLQKLAKLLNCDKEDLVPCLNDAQKVASIIENEWTNSNTLKTNFNFIVAPTKYIPELKEAIGDQLEAIRSRMRFFMNVSDERAVRQSGEDTVEALDSIKARIPEVREKYGEGSIEYLAALLQTNIVGLRGELGTVRVVKSDNVKTSNFYNSKTGLLKIREFKTKAHFPPYSINLPRGLMDEIDLSLRKHRRGWLMGAAFVPSSSYGPIVKRALGVNVMDIRHSMITKMLIDGGGPSASNVEKVAKLFKHSPQMTLRYFRNTIDKRPTEDEDGD